MTDFIGTPGSDVFTGTDGNDGFRLEAGGDDHASGADGNDGFYFGAALTIADIVDGGLGIDTIAIQGNYAALTLGAIGNVEVLLAMPGSDTRFGDPGGSFYSYSITTTDANLAAGRILQLVGGNLRAGESLSFNGSAESDGNFRVFAGQGTDTLRGGGGNDGFFFGQDGNLTGADRIDGGAGTDSVALRGNYVGGRAVLLEAASFANIEVITLLSGHSNEFGGFIDANGFDYDLTLADGNVASGQRLDVIAGNLRSNESVRFDGRAEGDGSLRIIAGAGNDVLFGGGGNDSLYGGLGADQLTGGNGYDLFGFTSALGPDNIDAIADFDTRNDRIELSGTVFGALASGTLGANWLGFGAEATQATHRIIYDNATGALLYDADGVGGEAAVQFATIAFAATPDGFNAPLFRADHFTITGPANQRPVNTSAAVATVDENLDPSAIVYQASASDFEGDAVAYYIIPLDGSGLTIDKSTGAVRLNASADFEEKSEYVFRVGVSDSSDRIIMKTVVLKVNDLAETLDATPVIAETTGNNGGTGTSAQSIARTAFGFADNSDLVDDGLRSIRIDGTISDPADRDFFEIVLNKGELLILDVDRSGGDLDTMLRVWKSFGPEILSNDDPGFIDPGSDPHPVYGHNTDSLIRFRAPTAGFYSFSIEAFQDPQQPTSGSYELNVSIGPPVPADQIWEEDIAAMLSPYHWDSTNLSFSYPTDPGQYPVGTEEVDEPGEFAALNGPQQNAVAASLAQIMAVSGLTFAPSQNPADADLRFAMSSAAEVAYAYYPTGEALAGTAWFNQVDFNQPVLGGYSWMAFLHETGHTLGLKHSQDGPAVNFDHDSLEFTVMTYRSYPGASIDPDEGYGNPEWTFPQSLMILDIAALQKLYGANYATNNGDTVYSWSPTNGQMFVNGVGQGVPGNGVQQANRVFLTIWDGGGNDTYDLSNYTNEVAGPIVIDLRPGEWTSLGSAQASPGQGVYLGDMNYARGNIANALMFEGDPRSLIENAIGSQAPDILIGNQIANRLTGSGGPDEFRWMSIDDSRPGAADTIMDFTHGWDRIDLRRLDADSASSTWRDYFTFVDTAAFSGTAGQLRWEKVGNDVHLFADVDGDAVADFQVILANLDALSGADFYL